MEQRDSFNILLILFCFLLLGMVYLTREMKFNDPKAHVLSPVNDDAGDRIDAR